MCVVLLHVPPRLRDIHSHRASTKKEKGKKKIGPSRSTWRFSVLPPYNGRVYLEALSAGFTSCSHAWCICAATDCRLNTYTILRLFFLPPTRLGSAQRFVSDNLPTGQSKPRSIVQTIFHSAGSGPCCWIEVWQSSNSIPSTWQKDHSLSPQY